MNLAQFIDDYKDTIARKVVETYTPLYQPIKDNTPIPSLLRRPMGLQGDAIKGTALSLRQNRGTTVVGEMGTGKTFIGAASAYMAGFKRPLVLCPPHLTEKWKREIKDTVPEANVVIVKSITDLEKLRTYRQEDPLYTIMSRERAKLSYHWKPAYILRAATNRGKLIKDPDTGLLIEDTCCPTCFQIILDNDEVPIPLNTLERKRHTCSLCNSALWQASNKGPRRYPLADYVKHRMKGFFDLCIADEVHEYKARGSAQGIAAGILAEVCGTSLTLTGTLMGGYSSTLFHLLYRFAPDIREDFKHSDESRWVSRYGFVEKIYTPKDGPDPVVEHGRSSRRRGYKVRTRELPGITPAALFHIIPNSVFLRLTDVAEGLPPYEEKILITNMEDDPAKHEGELTQHQAYNKLQTQVHQALAEALAAGSKRLLATYLQSLLAYPDGCTQGETVKDPRDGGIIVKIPPLNPDILYPKEQSLVDLVKQETKQGRRVLVYVTHTDTRDVTPRLKNALEKHSIPTAVLKSHTVPSEKREKWLLDQVAQGAQVLVCNPRLVQTGLDLIDFPTIVWFETDYSVYTMRQASRRSWRIGQKHPVNVYYMAYHDTLQAGALTLIARKMQSSLAVEGELPEEGLSAYGDDGQDMMLNLARQIVAGHEEEDDIESIFAKVKNTMDDDDTYLVDDEWRLPDPEIAPTQTPKTEPVQTPEPQALPAHQPEPQPPIAQGASTTREQEHQTLLTWKELLDQEPPPSRRKRNGPTAGASIFDWALENQAANT